MTLRILTTATAVATLVGFGCPVAVGQVLTVRREAAGQQTTQHSGGAFSTNTFNTSTLAGNNVGSYTTYGTSDPGVDVGTYTATPLANTNDSFGIFNDQFGGSTSALTRNNYFSTGLRTAPGSNSTFLSPKTTLTFSTTAYYLGIFWMAVDAPNSLTFRLNGVVVDTISSDRLLADLGTVSDPGIGSGTTYNGDDGNGTGKNAGEKYVYLNVYSNNTSQGFNEVVFDNVTSGSGFESDNHTIGTGLIGAGQQIGTLVPVPEPAGLLAAAGGLLAAVRRLRRA